MRNISITFDPPQSIFLDNRLVLTMGKHYSWHAEKFFLHDDVVEWLSNTVPNWALWAGDDYDGDPAEIRTVAWISFLSATDMIAFKLRWM
jgi:hypothetical protein